jgi:hypothetical protein
MFWARIMTGGVHCSWIEVVPVGGGRWERGPRRGRAREANGRIVPGGVIVAIIGDGPDDQTFCRGEGEPRWDG